MTVAGLVGGRLSGVHGHLVGRQGSCMATGEPSHKDEPHCGAIACRATSQLFRSRGLQPELEQHELLRRLLREDHTMPPRLPGFTSLPRRALSRAYSHIPAKPTWTTHSLLDGAAPESVSPAQLSHLLRLSALPQPRDAQEEAALLSDLQSQLRFVRRIQEVDTTGVEPLRAVRDETSAARDEATLGLEQLGDALRDEVTVGHYKRPRRVRKDVDTKGVEDWDPLKTASKTSGRYFVVEGGKESAE